jgi:Tfp pilus assembly protein PilP
MKLANTSAKLLAVLVVSLGLAAAAWTQAPPPPPAQASNPAKKPAMKAHPAKPAKAMPKAKAAPKANPEATPAPAAAEAPTAPGGDKIEAVGKRDPFAPLINEKKDSGQHLPPGKAGLVIATVRVDGAVRSGSSMIAVVSNPEQSVYFIREGDHLYDGDVEKIGLDGVTFKENSKDAFGKPVERVVTKRIYGSAGEQQ